jgi:nitrate/nitrite transport system permease protein
MITPLEATPIEAAPLGADSPLAAQTAPGLATAPDKRSGSTAARLPGIATSFGWMLAGVAGFVGLWQLVATMSTDLPTPIDGAKALIELVSDPFYVNGPNDQGIGWNLLISLGRVFAGFAAAAVVGIPLGMAVGASRRAWQAINPLVQILRPVSPLAWFPIMLAAFHNFDDWTTPFASMFVIFITALWPTLINTAAGAAAIPLDQRNVAKVFRFGRAAYVWNVLIPNALPSIITGLRLSMGIGWMVIVAVEMLSANSGIGYFVWDSYNAQKLSNVVAAIVLIGLVGLVLDAILLRISRWVTVEEVHA